ncbi:unnamed protein product, partial [Meganyctiphanes norvegica]
DSDCTCGAANEQSTRIIGGKEVDPRYKYPWQVALVYANNTLQCGGSIINNLWILTAAHCLIDKDDNNNPVRPLYVWVGKHDRPILGTDTSPDTKRYDIKTYTPHDRYNSVDDNYDFALLELTETIPFNNVIRPVCLPKDGSNDYAGEDGTVTGWGLTSNDGSLSDVLKEAQVPILANNKCGNWAPAQITGLKLCAGAVNNTAFCSGDSGGPLCVVEDNKYIEVGVVSFYAGEGNGCYNENYPGVYARVSKVLGWISDNAKSGTWCN